MSRRKGEFQVTHAVRRAWQRYGLAISYRDLANIIDRIENNHARLHEVQTPRVSVYVMNYRGIDDLPVVFDTKKKKVITFLPKAYLHHGRPKKKNLLTPRV